jgi:hypothetical protein
MKEKIELRIWADAVPHGYVTGWFLQRKRRRFLFFHRWENVGWFPNMGDALIAKVMFIPKERINFVHRQN